MNNFTKNDFPIFKNIPGLVYLDSAAMSLKPKTVIDGEMEYYEQYSANVFRGVYKISEKATEEYEKTRVLIAGFINARQSNEIVFVRNTTEAANLLAYSWGRINISEGDEIITTIMEHHSNFVPWQQLVFEAGAVFKVIDIDDQGYLDIYDKNFKSQISNAKCESKRINLEKIVTKKTKLLALTYVSNALGTINPIKEIIQAAKKINPNILIIVDAAQAVPHMPVDVQDLGCDALIFSGQKMLGPTGTGVLWAKQDLLEQMVPFMFGGEMIRQVHLDKTLFADIPHKFEAGTPNISGIIGLGRAVKYLENIGMDNIRKHEKDLAGYAINRFKGLSGIKLVGLVNENDRSAVITFVVDGVHGHDVAQILDESSICVRSGHHCAMPLHERLKLDATVRASFYIYNTREDVDKLIEGLEKVKCILM